MMLRHLVIVEVQALLQLCHCGCAPRSAIAAAAAADAGLQRLLGPVIPAGRRYDQALRRRRRLGRCDEARGEVPRGSAYAPVRQVSCSFSKSSLVSRNNLVIVAVVEADGCAALVLLGAQTAKAAAAQDCSSLMTAAVLSSFRLPWCCRTPRERAGAWHGAAVRPRHAMASCLSMSAFRRHRC